MLVVSGCTGGGAPVANESTNKTNITPVAPEPEPEPIEVASLSVVKCANEQNNAVTAVDIKNTGDVEIDETFKIYNADSRTDTGLRLEVTDVGHGLLAGQTRTFYTKDAAGATSPISSTGDYVLVGSGFPEVDFECSIETPNVALQVTNCVVNDEGTFVTAKNVGGNRIMTAFNIYKSDGTPVGYAVEFREMEPGAIHTNKVYTIAYGGSPEMVSGTYLLKAAGYTDIAFEC